ncbi:hypothetical protein NQ315_000427 [Exocentrus adspersus]|uniref:Oxidoreductase-like domain-containing protein n=1 Tax=Exocentrus adspersus TaxID=1586481 RepID=A0AAV8VM13_9CUCU|nr:hypothetical protein NQ315_000427 [Exocentrus adspersus]
MIHIYHSCRNAKLRINGCTKTECSRFFSLNIQFRCRSKNEQVPESKPKNDKTEPKTDSKSKQNEYPEEPTTCCMSGCSNCVWLDYAEKLSEYYRDRGERAVKEINEKVTDPSIKAFLLHELRMRNFKM